MMSFEGYYQLICKNGHSYDAGLYCGDEEKTKCPICNENSVWWNLVNTTNGSFDEHTNERIDGYIELELNVEKICKECDSILERKYKIPKKQ